MYDDDDMWVGAEGAPEIGGTRSAGGYTQDSTGRITGYDTGYDSTMDDTAGYNIGYDETMGPTAGTTTGFNYDDTMDSSAGYNIGYDSTMSNAAGYTPGYDNTMTNAAGYYPGYDETIDVTSSVSPGFNYDDTMTASAGTSPGFNYDTTMGTSAGSGILGPHEVATNMSINTALADEARRANEIAAAKARWGSMDDSTQRTMMASAGKPDMGAMLEAMANQAALANLSAAGGMEFGGILGMPEIETNVDVGGTRGSATGGFGRE